MAMNDNINIEIEAGRIPVEFSPADLLHRPTDDAATTFRIGRNEYKKSSIITGLNNLSIGPGERLGNQVQKGNSPHYQKMDSGRFRLIEEALSGDHSSRSSDDADADDTEPARGSAARLTREEIFGDFVGYLANKPFRISLGKRGWYPDQAVVGWAKRIEFYAWPLKTIAPDAKRRWPATNQTLIALSQRIRDFREAENMDSQAGCLEAKRIYDAIRKWGNPRGRDRSGAEVVAAIRSISGQNIPVENEVDSTLTKLFALTSPGSYVIYDSRVATAIVSIAEDIYRRTKINAFRNVFRYFGHMDSAASAGTRPRGRRHNGWPDAYRSWNAQIDANELCVGIRNCLNDRNVDGKNDWNLREVEAVLFMEGY